MGTFAVCQAPLQCTGASTTVTFLRASASQNSAGEILLSYSSAVSLGVELQPEGGGYPRFLQGTVTEVNFTAYAYGGPDVRVGDRAVISGANVEVINVQYYPDAQTELALRWVR
jgi:hypothetical protein